VVVVVIAAFSNTIVMIIENEEKGNYFNPGWGRPNPRGPCQRPIIY